MSLQQTAGVSHSHVLWHSAWIERATWSPSGITLSRYWEVWWLYPVADEAHSDTIHNKICVKNIQNTWLQK